MQGKVVFLLTHIPDPRMNKRIKVAKEVGEVEVICVRREKQDIWIQHHHDVPHHILSKDFPSSRDMTKRIKASFIFACFALKHLRESRPTCIYTGSLDSLLISVWYQLWHRKPKLVFEVADLREAFTANKSFKYKLLNFIEKQVYLRVNLLVLTCELFYQRHFHQFFSKENVLVLPNIPDLHHFKDYQSKKDGPFTVGFIGGIRYLNQMKMLVDAAQECPVHILFAGAGGHQRDMDEIQAYCQGKPGITFTGRYDYAVDIAKLYGMVDCVYAVYDADNANVRIALPNKLYEAAYCELPLIVAKGTYLSEIVTKHNLGVAVNHKDTQELANVLKTLQAGQHHHHHISVSGNAYLASLEVGSLKERFQSLMTGHKELSSRL